jgi:hypothetical protein
LTPTVSVVVMADPRRAAMVEELLGWLDRPAEVVWDRKGDRWDTGRRAWQAIDRTTSHGLVVQDDAIPCRDLVAGIEQALQHVPDGSPLCLYVGKVRPYRELVQGLVNAAGPGTSWLAMGQLHWGVGVVMPTRYIDEMLAWVDRYGEVENYDTRISRWFQQRNLTVYCPWPSLVDHRDAPSLVPGRTSVRKAHRFLGAEVSALDQDWCGRVVSVPALAPLGRPEEIHDGMWRVVGHACHASVATATGRARQLFFRGSVLSGVPVVEVMHLMSIGLIEPVSDFGPVEAT